MNSEQVLANVELFADLPNEDLSRIARLAVLRTYKAGDVIVSEGEMGVAFYVVCSGRVEVVKAGKPIGAMEAGGFFGEMALFDNQLRSATVHAAEDSECLVITKWDFAAELNHPRARIANAMLSVLARRIRRLDEAVSH